MTLTWELVLGVLGGFVAVDAGVRVLLKWMSPAKQLKETLAQHTRLLENDHKRLQEQEETSRLICRTLMLMLEHSITGNSIDKLKAQKTELQEYLINK